MTLDQNGNYHPWVQPNYGFDAQDKLVISPENYEIVPQNTVIEKNWLVFDIYAGWMKSDNYNFRNKHLANSYGRWTTWARKIC